MENENLLVDGLLKIGIPQSQITDLAEKMEKYINEIILFNSAYNLTNTSNHDELVIRHILDSLAAYNQILSCIKDLENLQEDSELILADIGSGGGLPGIPLAAAFPEIQFRLVERMAKRCAFLENCAAILGLKNIQVINLEAEQVDAESFHLITFRAFRPLDKKMTKTLLRIVKPNGYLCAYKAKKENILEEMAGINSIVPDYKMEELKVPGLEDSERNLVIIKK